MTADGNSLSDYIESPNNVAQFRKLRADILASLGRREPKSILTIGASERDDATPVAAGAATAFAAAGYDVVLVDGPVRSTECASGLRQESGPGPCRSVGRRPFTRAVLDTSRRAGPRSACRRRESEPLCRSARFVGLRAFAWRTQASAKVGHPRWRHPESRRGDGVYCPSRGRGDSGGHAR